MVASGQQRMPLRQEDQSPSLTLLRSLLFKGPSRDFVVSDRPFGVPEASIWDFGMIHVCVNVGCFPFDCPFFCRFANVIFFELVVFSF